MNYYNEFDPFAAAWLRELIKDGQVAPGEVDERSIEDVLPNDLLGFTQCHFFAGIGGWSYALRAAGWPDDRPVWTGSCPCQPYSSAGKGKGFADERHLWPAQFHLIEQFKPTVFFGEQVEAAIRHGWLDLVQSDLEGSGYAFGAVGVPAAGVGAPHIRQRLYFVADSLRAGSGTERNVRGDHGSSDTARQEVGLRTCDDARVSSVVNRVGNPDNTRSQGQQLGRLGSDQRTVGTPGLVNGFWSDADWIYCRDEKYRPVEPGTFPLAHGASNRVGRLRGYGNAIVAPVAQAFITSYLDATK